MGSGGGLRSGTRERGGRLVRGRGQQPTAWRDAQLQGPRRFFGLIPDVWTVRSRRTKDPQWEIDGGMAGGAVDGVDGLGVNGEGGDTPPMSGSSGSGSAPSSNAGSGSGSRSGGHTRDTTRTTEPTHPRASSSMSRHSHATSITSLLPSLSLSPSSGGLFTALKHKFSFLSLKKDYDYEIGTSKGKDYRKVHVRTASPVDRNAFKIDGGTPVRLEPPTGVLVSPEGGSVAGEEGITDSEQGTPLERFLPPRRRDSLPRDFPHVPSSLPSVLDIHGPDGPARSISDFTRTGTRTNTNTRTWTLYTHAETVDSAYFVPQETLGGTSEAGYESHAVLSPTATSAYVHAAPWTSVGVGGSGSKGAGKAGAGGGGGVEASTKGGQTALRTGTRSDYSLVTADLQTPITPSRDAAAAYPFAVSTAFSFSFSPHLCFLLRVRLSTAY